MVNTLGMDAEQLLERAEAYDREAARLRKKAAELGHAGRLAPGIVAARAQRAARINH